MFKNVKEIDFTDFEVAIPSFITIATMPLTYSISTGLSFGFVSYILITLAAGDRRKIQPAMYVIGILALINIFFK